MLSFLLFVPSTLGESGKVTSLASLFRAVPELLTLLPPSARPYLGTEVDQVARNDDCYLQTQQQSLLSVTRVGSDGREPLLSDCKSSWGRLANNNVINKMSNLSSSARKGVWSLADTYSMCS